MNSIATAARRASTRASSAHPHLPSPRLVIARRSSTKTFTSRCRALPPSSTSTSTKKKVVLEPVTYSFGGDGSNNNNNNNNNGGGGGGGGDDGGGGKNEPGDNGEFSGKGIPGVAAVVGAWMLLTSEFAGRVEADPNFTFKIGAELLNDTAIILFVNAVARKDRFFEQLDQVLCHWSVAMLNDICLVCLLAPVAGVAAQRQAAAAAKAVAVGGLRARFAGLPAHMFMAGNFTLEQKFLCWCQKAVLYSVIGFCSGVLGTAAVNVSSSAKTRADPERNPPLPEYNPTLMSGFAWLLYMGIGSNTRYQMVNGVERVAFNNLPVKGAKLVSYLTRITNCFTGGTVWVWWADKIHLAKPNPLYEEYKK